MKRSLYLWSPFILGTLLGVGSILGCDSPESDAQLGNDAALAACHLKDGTVGRDAQLRACDPGDQKKTTICHIPPGNPANAHTLCIGNAAVPAHLTNHGDYLGICQHETPCPPPAGTGGTSGAGGITGSGGSGTGGQPIDGVGGSVVIVP
jgi:hypothetical protein